MLDLLESFAYLKNLPISDFIIINSKTDLKKASDKLGIPLFLKIDSSEHKLNIGGIKKVNNFEELVESYQELKKKFPNKKIIAQRFISGVEFIIGIKKDNTFGRVLMIGAGGSNVERMKDISFRAFPVTKEEIEKMLNELKISNDISEKVKNNLKGIVMKLVELNLNRVNEIDINPVIINDKSAFIVDARVGLSQL